MPSRWKSVALLLVFLAGVVAARFLLGDSFEPARVVAWLREAGSGWQARALFVVLFGVATTLLVPSIGMMAVAGATWGFFPGWVIAYVSVNLWVHVGFLAGRYFGDGRLAAWLQNKGGGVVARELRDGGVIATVMLRQLPLPYPVVNVTAGLTALRWRDWFVGNLLGLLPNCLIYSSLASALVDGAAGAKEDAALRALMSTGAILTLGLLTRWFQRRRTA